MYLVLRELKLLAIGLFLAISLGAATCESLSAVSLPRATLTLAQTVPAAGKLPAYCRVALTLSPTSDSDIKAEVWLPIENWNGKFEANGNGGWSGSISAATLAAGLARGYATAMSDLGHQGSSASFALGHPEKLIDFGYRAAHETTVAAKAIVAAYYGSNPKYSYWTGCSAGGRSALMEAQRFPDDFDGIVAGSPGLNWIGRATQAIWIAQASHKDESSYIPHSKYAMVHRAVLEACDAADGVADGVLNDPTKCKFDPAALRCKDSDGPNCLTSPQVAAAQAFYSAVINPRTKQQLSPGSERGSEMGWATMGGPQPLGIGFDLFRYIAFKDPAWDYKTLNFDIEIPEGAILNAMDPHLDAFVKRGGKLIQYHGWSDPQIAPAGSIDYYKSVLNAMGTKIQDSYRLFMVPGMAHCGGGDGTSTFDALTALEQWVEAGKAPAQIPASRVRAGKPDRTRPLCPYPQLAVYKGSGNTDEALNFECK
jgi:feruloyl esterase